MPLSSSSDRAWHSLSTSTMKRAWKYGQAKTGMGMSQRGALSVSVPWQKGRQRGTRHPDSIQKQAMEGRKWEMWRRWSCSEFPKRSRMERGGKNRKWTWKGCWFPACRRFSLQKQLSSSYPPLSTHLDGSEGEKKMLCYVSPAVLKLVFGIIIQKFNFKKFLCILIRLNKTEKNKEQWWDKIYLIHLKQNSPTHQSNLSINLASTFHLLNSIYNNIGC